MARKVKQVKRWAVRDGDTPLTYWLTIGDRPPRRDNGGHDLSGLAFCLAADSFEMFFPKCFHRKPGGGPVEIEFKEL